MPSCGHLLSGLRETADAFHVADDAGEVVKVGAVAFGAFVEVTFVDVAAVVADGVGDVECEIIAALLRGHAEQLTILCLRKVLFQISVQSRSARQVRDVAAAMKSELVDKVQRVILHSVEVAVVAVTRHAVAILTIPFCVFHAYVLRRNHLAVEEQFFALVLVVVLLDQSEHVLHKMLVLWVVVNWDVEEFRSFHQTVHTDGEILAVDGDIARIEQRKHSFGLQIFEVLVVADLHLVHQVNDFADELELRDVVAAFVLDAAVDIDGEHALGTGGDTACAKRVAEAVVLDFVAQAAAAAQRVGVVAHVCEEGVACGVHFRREIGVFRVDNVTVFGEQCHGLDREGEHGTEAFLVEPAHKPFLKPAERLPDGLGAVGETELTEEAFEVVAIVVGHIPEHRLEITCASGLVDGIDHLLETVGDHLVNGALPQGEIHHLVALFIVVVAVFLADEVVHVHQELRGGASTAEHAGDHEDHVDEAAAVGLEVRGCGGVATDAFRAVQQPRVHGDGSAVVCDACFIVLIDKVVVEEVQVFVGQFFAVDVFDFVAEKAAVEADEIGLGQFADEGGDVLAFYVGIGIVLAACGGVGGVAVVDKEVEFLFYLTVFIVALSVQDVCFGNLIVTLRHKRDFHLVLDFLHGDAVVDFEAAHDVDEHILCREAVHGEECLGDGVFDFFGREWLPFAVTFDDVQLIHKMVKVLVVNKNSSGITMAGESPFSFALSPESHERRLQAGLLARSRFFPPSRQGFVSDILEKAQNGTHSYGHSR